MRFEHQTLDNGLHILGEHHPEAQSIAVGFFVRTGSRDEAPEVAGVSHFLEHMMFKGTPRRTAADINREFDEMGARYNAFTSEENTVYFGSVLPEFQTRLIDLLADMMRPSLRPEDFDLEKQVILEEIALYQDRPQFIVMDMGRETFFGDHPLGRRVLGTTESIRALTRDQMYEYFSHRYAPNNMSLILTGRYDWETAVAQAQELCGGWEPAEARRELTPPQPRPRVRVEPKGRFQRAHLALVAPGCAAQEETRFAAAVAATALGAAQGSRFYWALVDPGLAETATLSHSEEDGAGVFLGYLCCNPERAAEVLDTARRVLEEVCREGLNAEEVARAKRKMASGQVLAGETPFGRLIHVGLDWVYRQEWQPLEEVIDRILAVSVEEVNDLLARQPFAALTVVALGAVSALGCN